MVIKRSRAREFAALAKFAIEHKSVYTTIEKKTSVPWWLIAVLHRRESSADFRTYLGNGDPLSRRTVHVPRGRGPFPNFIAGAIDALRMDGLSSVKDWNLEKSLFWAESFNGWGYANMGKPSPYVFGGSSIQVRGKFVADGQWSGTVWDTQPGCAPIIHEIARLDTTVKLTRES